MSVRHPALFPYLVVALCSFVLFRDGILHGDVFYERDTYLFYEPLTRWFADRLGEGQIPLWIPLIFGGYPLFADGEIGMLYPLNLLLLPALPPSTRLSALRAVHLFLAGAFMIAFLRQLGLGRWGALVGALVFAFGSFFVAQIHHENLVRSAVWLPLILLFVERALQRGDWSRQPNLVAAGLGLAVAGQGLHVQAVAMTVLVLGAYTTFRLAVGPVVGRAWERLWLLVWAPGLVAAVGAAGSAVQWLPLLELGRTSYRGPGLAYDLAATWPLRWQNLPTALFPYLFRMDDGRYVTLWQQWESFLYVGIAPLVLAVVGILLSRNRLAPFFLLVALAGLVIGLADHSPVNVHKLIWSIPGFASLRAPGRFAFLVVFGVAGLAAVGMDWLGRRDRRTWPGVAVGLAAVAAAGLVAWLVNALYARLAADPVRWLRLIDEYYLSTRREHGWLTGRMVYDQLLAGLDLGNPKTALSILLLGVAGIVVAVASCRHRTFVLPGSLLVSLIAVDLLIFGSDFHPKARLDQLLEADRVTELVAARVGSDRVFAESEVAAFEPNRPLFAGVASIGGYSSLQSQRHFEYWTSVDRQPDALLDIWGVRHVVLVDPPGDVVVADGAAYRPYSPLFNGAAFNRTGLAAFEIGPTGTIELRVLSTLVDGVEIEQGAPVAEIVLVGTDGSERSILLRAGLDTAENAYDRADVLAHVRHTKARVVGTVPDVAPTGEPTRTYLYGATFPIDAVDAERIEIRQISPHGQTRLFGIGLVRPDGSVRSLFNADRQKFRELFRSDGAVVFQNSWAFPRAYVVTDAIARRTRSEESALPRLAKRPFDAATQVVLEEGPLDDLPAGTASPYVQPAAGLTPRAAEVEDLSTEHVRVRTPDGPGGYLVLTDAYHRGWRATVDGEETAVYLANFLSRAVRIPPGPHVVDFSFDPLSLRVGRALTIGALIFAAAVILMPPRAVGRVWRRKRGRCP